MQSNKHQGLAVELDKNVLFALGELHIKFLSVMQLVPYAVAAICLSIIIFIDGWTAPIFLLGMIVVAITFISAEFGIIALLAAISFFSRSELFSVSIPIFGGGIKPTDILLLTILAGWSSRAMIYRRKLLKGPHLVVSCTIAFVVWSLFCAFNGIRTGVPYKYALLELRPLLQYLLVLPVLAEFNDKKLSKVLFVFLFISIGASIKALALYHLGIGETATYTEGEIRIMSIEFAYPMLASILGAAFFAKKAMEIRQKIFLVFVVFVNLAALTVTFQRSGWLGIFGGLLLVFLLGTRFQRKKLVKLICWLFLAGIFAYLVPAATGGEKLKVVSALQQRLVSVFDYEEDTSAQHRLEEWKATLKQISKHPLVGSGLGSKVAFYTPMYLEDARMSDTLSQNIYVHNSYLWLMLKTGLIGTLLFLSLVFFSMKVSVITLKLRKHSSQSEILPGLFGCIFALMIISFFGPMFNVDNLTPFAAVLIGVLCLPDHNFATSNQS